VVDPVSASKAVSAAVGKLDEPNAVDGPAGVIAGYADLDPDTAEFLSKAWGGEIRSIFGPTLRYIRLKRALKVAEKAARLLDQKGRKMSGGDLNVLLPLLEAASLQGEEEMCDRWAALLANATDPEGSAVEPSFPDVLRQLSSTDARLIEYIVNRSELEATAAIDDDDDDDDDEPVGEPPDMPALDRSELLAGGPIPDPEDYMISLDNLLRLRILISDPLVRSRPRAVGGARRRTTVTFDDDRVKLSAYGAKFARAVRRPSQ
jgi:hypothetical protein